MTTTPPSWLDSLGPVSDPVLKPISRYSSAVAWHVRVEFTPWPVPAGRTLTGGDTWNGKALLVPSSRDIEASVGEVEVAERLRAGSRGRASYWTAGGGHPPAQWRAWALTQPVRKQAQWLIDADRRIRDTEPILAGNQRGWPDVVSWQLGYQDLLCVEYKGPQPSNPAILDEVSVEQDAWFRVAVRLQVLDVDRFAVVSWVPSPDAAATLRQQSAARATRRANPIPSGDAGGAAETSKLMPLALHGDEKLHRRTIRRVLIDRLDTRVVSHVDGTIDVEIPRGLDPRAFRDRVVQEVTSLGYTPVLHTAPPGIPGVWVRVSTSETMDQQGRGAHRDP